MRWLRAKRWPTKQNNSMKHGHTTMLNHTSTYIEVFSRLIWYNYIQHSLEQSLTAFNFKLWDKFFNTVTPIAISIGCVSPVSHPRIQTQQYAYALAASCDSSSLADVAAAAAAAATAAIATILTYTMSTTSMVNFGDRRQDIFQRT